MKVKIICGSYGYRTKYGVKPVMLGDTCEVDGMEAGRLVGLGVAEIVDAPAAPSAELPACLMPDSSPVCPFPNRCTCHPTKAVPIIKAGGISQRHGHQVSRFSAPCTGKEIRRGVSPQPDAQGLPAGPGPATKDADGARREESGRQLSRHSPRKESA